MSQAGVFALEPRIVLRGQLQESEEGQRMEVSLSLERRQLGGQVLERALLTGLGQLLGILQGPVICDEREHMRVTFDAVGNEAAAVHYEVSRTGWPSVEAVYRLQTGLQAYAAEVAALMPRATVKQQDCIFSAETLYQAYCGRLEMEMAVSGRLNQVQMQGFFAQVHQTVRHQCLASVPVAYAEVFMVLDSMAWMGSWSRFPPGTKMLAPEEVQHIEAELQRLCSEIIQDQI